MTVRKHLGILRGGSRSIRPGFIIGALLVAGSLVFAGGSRAASHPRGLGQLPDSVRTALSGVLGRGEIGLLAISLDRGDTLVALNPAQRLIPGSAAKILTTSAFLRRFGTAARCTTYIAARGKAKEDKGRVHLKGDLYLRGSGAPDVTQLLSPGSRGLLDSVAFLLHANGLERFEGTLWIDGTLFAPEPYAPSWALEDIPHAYGAPINAILANGNAASLVATAGPRGVSLALEPPEVPITLDARVVMAPAGQPGWLDVDRRPFDARLRVRGQVPPDGTLRKQISVPDPDSTAGLMLLGAMRRAGIELKKVQVRVVPHAGQAGGREVEGPVSIAGSKAGWREVKKDRRSVVLAHASPSSAEIAGIVNAVSLNAEAEALLRLLDNTPTEKRRDAGLRELRRLAGEAGVDTLDLSLVDGSGLSPQNLLTARAVVRWLWSHDQDSTLAGPFRDRLATPGTLGTLKNRFPGLDPRRELRAKTGSLTNVSALAGYLRTFDGERIAFAMITNGNRGSIAPARQAEEEVVGVLSRFRRDPMVGPLPHGIPR